MKTIKNGKIWSFWLTAGLVFLFALNLSARPRKVDLKADSTSCVSCHKGIERMHPTAVGVTCVGCHGGRGDRSSKFFAHVSSRTGSPFKTSANPKNSYTFLGRESPEFIRFMNPGDLRVAGETCGQCHGGGAGNHVERVKRSLMAHSSVVPGATLYNNGVHKAKKYIYGEQFNRDSKPISIKSLKRPNRYQRRRGALPELRPLPRWEAFPPNDPFRVQERGNVTLSDRGSGTKFNIAAAVLILQKTRLNDPFLWYLGANTGPGDYRSSGCSACHVVYANDRQKSHSGPYAKYGNRGYSFSKDKNIPKKVSGHPIKHKFTTSIPDSNCMTCHHHQGNGALTTFQGYIWHDQETDLARLSKLKAGQNGKGQINTFKNNRKLRQIKLADQKGHGWNYRAVFKRDYFGRLLNALGRRVRSKKRAVHLKDIHLQKGMGCIDCHTQNDLHGNGMLYGSMSDPVEMSCKNCHGAKAPATLKTLNPNGKITDFTGLSTPFGKAWLERVSGKVVQNSKLKSGKSWVVPQISESKDPKAIAAHSGTHMNKMECFACHSSWNTGCKGCHLAVDVRKISRDHHYTTRKSRIQTGYYPQIVKTDSFMLGISGDAKGNKITPMRSASAVTISVYDAFGNIVINEQPTISAPGNSGNAVTFNFPHTVRKTETKACDDCHLKKDESNNTKISSILGMGVNGYNFMGRFAYTINRGKENNIRVLQVTEGYEPRPVVGSSFYKALCGDGKKREGMGCPKLKPRELFPVKDVITLKLTEPYRAQLKGEYVIVADGAGGVKILDAANIANKSVALKMITRVNSPLGERLYVRSKKAVDFALASRLPMDLNRKVPKVNREQKLPAYFRYLFVADQEEGLITVDINTLYDRDPTNNYLKRKVTYNPRGRLKGLRALKLYGRYLYAAVKKRVYIIDVSRPGRPRLRGSIRVAGVTSMDSQFGRLFLNTGKRFYIYNIRNPRRPRRLKTLRVRARNFALYKDFVYFAGGRRGLGYLRILNPRRTGRIRYFNPGRAFKDASDVKLAVTNASTFAYVTDAKQGGYIVELVGPGRTPDVHFGFSPRPRPALVARFPVGSTMSIGGGLRRDRVIDEDGRPIMVSGRVGGRGFNFRDIKRFLFDRFRRPIRVD